MSKSGSKNGGGGNHPFAWLGLMKWSLQYSDGTSSEPPVPMSAEDRAFLEKVMREGIIDENERMKIILQQVTNAFEYWKSQFENNTNSNGHSNLDTAGVCTDQQQTEEGQADQQAAEGQVPDLDELLELLQELRDIVEQVDYAQAFCSLGGLPFLLGCISERKAIPTSIRALCLGIIATLCQNNPPVQLQLLELGSLKVLCDLYFSEDDDPNAMIRTRIVQAASANVRSHARVEEVFCQLPQSVGWIEAGLQVQEPFALRQRTLFFLRALITSDTSTSFRVQQFESCVMYVFQHYLIETSPQELREMALGLINQIMEQGNQVISILQQKAHVTTLAEHRLTALRSMASSHEVDDFEMEREEWERLTRNFANAGDNLPPDAEVQESRPTRDPSAPVLMIEQNPFALPQ